MGLRNEVTGLRANGEEFPARATISRLDVMGTTGTRRYFTALVCDLSEVRHLQAEIESVNNRIRAIFELVPIAIWITDRGQVVFANQACLSLFAAPDRQAIVGKSITTLLGPESQHHVHQAVDRALATRGTVPAVKEQIACRDGTTRDVEIVVAPLPDHGTTALQMVITDITKRAEEDREAEQSRQELRQLSANLVQAREEERRRIARELHDELGQRLSTLHMELSNLPVSRAGRADLESVSSMLAMVDETVASVRRIATELRPLMLDDLGLKAAIEWLARDWARRKGIPVHLDLWDQDPPIGDTCAIALFRMVQEALTNIIRHAHASRADIRLHLEHDQITLTVQDDGVGFPAPSPKRKNSHGLLGMRERAQMLGGHMEAGASALGGALICIRLPLEHPAARFDSPPAATV
jgi:PAS domain S-box-containing protein